MKKPPLHITPEKSPKGLKLFLGVKKQIESSSVEVPGWIAQIREEIEKLQEEVESVLKREEAEDRAIQL